MSLKDRFEEVILRAGAALDNNKYLSAIKSAFMIVIPLIMIGSFGVLFGTIISDPTTGLARWIPFFENLKPAFDALSSATISTMSLPIVFLIGLYLGEKNGLPKYPSGILAFVSYLLVVPNFVNVPLEDGTILTVTGLSSSVLGAQGLIIGMIIAILSIEVFTLFMKIDFIRVKLPDSVPPMVATSFNTLIPSFLTTLTIAILGVFFKLGTGEYLNEFVYSVVQVPLENVMQSGAGIVVIIIVSQLLWFVGIHGGAVIAAIRNPIFLAGLAANVQAVSTGLDPTEPLTFGFWRSFVTVGGAGMVISLILAILIASRRADHRSIAKVGLFPSIFGISEPIVFGLPLVLNVTFLIPFVFNSAISALIAIFAMKIGFLIPNSVDVPFGLPILFNALVSYGWQGVVVQAISIIIATLAWMPFVLISNKQTGNV